MSHPSIMVLDSGIGGLSVVGKIRELCPPLQVHYLADLAGFPYGLKSEAALLQRVITLLEINLPICQPDLVVIACNTASTLVLDQLRRRFPMPFVGVVPAIKPAAHLTQTGVIALLATEGTVNREYTLRLIRDFAVHHQVIRHGSAKLVLLAEQKLKGEQPSTREIAFEIQPLRDAAPNLDTVVLACTHFPLLKDELCSALPEVRFWVDSGDAIARRVQYWLVQLGIDKTATGAMPVNQFLLTGRSDFGYDVQSIKQLLGEFRVLHVSD